MTSPTFRFLHAADLHLDTPFEGLSVSDPQLRRRLVNASLDALDALVDVALRERVLFVALAGDLYDGADRGLRAQLRLRAATERLSEAGIWTFIAHGNHDPVEEGWSAIRTWPERVKVFPGDRAETVELTTPEGGRVTVTGTSYPQRDTRQGLHTRFTRPVGPGFHVAILHATVGTPTEHAPYSPCRLDDLIARHFDAWLLGHIHRSLVVRDRDPFVAYPGNLQGRSFKPSEQGPKGVLVVDVVDGDPRPRFIKVGPIQFKAVEVDASACADLPAVVEAIHAAVRDSADGETVVRVRVTGCSPAHHDLTGDDAERELREALEDRRALLPLVTWTTLDLATHPPLDLDTLADRGDLIGQLAREHAALRADGKGTRLALHNHKAMGSLLPDLTEDDLRDIVDRAAALALDLLHEEA